MPDCARKAKAREERLAPRGARMAHATGAVSSAIGRGSARMARVRKAKATTVGTTMARAASSRARTAEATMRGASMAKADMAEATMRGTAMARAATAKTDGEAMASR